MPDTLIEPDIRYFDACRQEVVFTEEMLSVLLELLHLPQSADVIRLLRQALHIEPLTTLRKMWEGFLVIPQTTPPIGSTIWFITGRGQSILNARAQAFRDGSPDGKPKKLRLEAP